jgi:hypothetical protein
VSTYFLMVANLVAWGIFFGGLFSIFGGRSTKKPKPKTLADLIVDSLKGRPEDWELDKKSASSAVFANEKAGLFVYPNGTLGNSLTALGVSKKEARDKLGPAARELLTERLKGELGV